MEPVGLLGGTFDPVHCGHLRLALEMRELLELPAIVLMPARVPPHRPPPGVAANLRLRMLAAAIENVPELAIDERELRRDGPSYTVDTLLSLRAEAPERPLCLLLGMDAFAGLATWYRWREIIELAHIGVARRPGATDPAGGQVAALVRERGTDDPAVLRSAPAGSVLIRDIPALDISASRIRELIAAGRSVRYLVPDGTLEIIMKEGLYRD